MAGDWMIFISRLAHSGVAIVENDVAHSVRRILLIAISKPDAFLWVTRLRKAPYSSCRHSAKGLRVMKLSTAGIEMNSLGPIWPCAPAAFIRAVVLSSRCCLPEPVGPTAIA